MGQENSVARQNCTWFFVYDFVYDLSHYAKRAVSAKLTGNTHQIQTDWSGREYFVFLEV